MMVKSYVARRPRDAQGPTLYREGPTLYPSFRLSKFLDCQIIVETQTSLKAHPGTYLFKIAKNIWIGVSSLDRI